MRGNLLISGRKHLQPQVHKHTACPPTQLLDYILRRGFRKLYLMKGGGEARQDKVYLVSLSSSNASTPFTRTTPAGMP